MRRFLCSVYPRDRKAKIELTRPRDLGKFASADPRSSYDTLIINVDADSKPYHERIEVNVTIDDNLILKLEAKSTLTGDRDSREIYNLEFGLALPKPNEYQEKKTRFLSLRE